MFLLLVSHSPDQDLFAPHARRMCTRAVQNYTYSRRGTNKTNWECEAARFSLLIDCNYCKQVVVVEGTTVFLSTCGGVGTCLIAIICNRVFRAMSRVECIFVSAIKNHICNSRAYRQRATRRREATFLLYLPAPCSTHQLTSPHALLDGWRSYYGVHIILVALWGTYTSKGVRYYYT